MKYHITYEVSHHPDGLSKEAVSSGRGACSAILIGSLLFPEDGSLSAAFFGQDGRTGDALSSAEMWKAWTLLAKHLADSEDLSEGKRRICKEVFEAVCAAAQAAAH